MAYGGPWARGAASAVRRRWSNNVAVDHDQAQSARIKEGAVVEVGPSSEDNDLSAAQPQARHDFSTVQGFQVVGAERCSAPQTASDQAWRDALRLELEARAARLHQAVDAAIVLSNDGIIRWLGDPVARLSPGADGLNPTAVILADETLPDTSRETISMRIGLWIAATTRRVLAPLFALDAIQEGTEIVRDLAREVVRSLGVLEREPIRAKIKALSQDDRAELRKLGVRFGAYYIFVPALIKPGPRTLALQLWGLQAPGDASELLRSLGPVASSGRTSLPLDKGISREGYRVAGYRPCGDRIVRVDVVERLAGMIRAALGGESPGGPGHRSSKGFVVTGEMTSLTGCSGEQFGSILRSMGFRPVEMKRTDFFGSPSPEESRGQGESVAPAEDQRSATHDQVASLDVPEDETKADPALAAPPVEPLPDAVAAGANAVPEDIAAPLACVDPEDTANANPEADGADAVPKEVAAPLVSAEPADGALAADAVAESGDAPPEDTAAPLASADPSLGAPGADAPVQVASQQTSASRPANADVVIVWRPDRRRISPSREREGKQSKSETPGRSDTDGRRSDQTPKRTREAVARLPTKPNRPDRSRADEKRRQRMSGYDMPSLAPTTAPQHGAKVDPNSPFAKLLELRSLLEEQANKRS
jgi:ATP-dependent RNA helicase SUPV3L1/SUV3